MKDEARPHTRQEGEILRDISRTFPLEPLFRESSGVGQNLLANVLKACLAFHDDVGCVCGRDAFLLLWVLSDDAFDRDVCLLP